MAGDFKPKMRDKNLLDSKRIKLETKCPVKNVQGWSSLHYYANNDNPGITVYTGDPGDKGNNFGRIQAKFGVLDFMAHLAQLDAVIKSKEPITMDCVCDSIRGQGKAPIPVAKVTVGKRPDGVVFICVEDLETPNRPIIHFSFAPTRFHHFAINGVPCTEAELSQLIARSWHDLAKQASVQVSISTYKHPEPKPQNGQGGGGGYGGGQGGGYRGGNNGGGGGYNNRGNAGGGGGGYSGGGDSSADADDDIPF